VNLDETSISLCRVGQRGIVLPTTKSRDVVLVKQKNPHRGALTHVAVICDDPALQPLLPQFTIGNENILRTTDLASADVFLQPNAYLLRKKSGWVDTPVFCQILQALAKAIRATNKKL